MLYTDPFGHNFYQMNKLIFFFTFLVLISCKAKHYIEGTVLPVGRPEYERQIPTKSNYYIVEAFFKEWLNKCKPITESEFSNLDSIQKMCYETYESLMTDTSVLNVNLNLSNARYILVPNSISFGYATDYKKEYEIIFFDGINSKRIENFRPRLSFENKKILYYTKEYKDTLPSFAEKYGVGSFLEINCYLMSHFPKYLETAPCIQGITNIKNTNKYIIDYDYRNGFYQSLLEKQDDKWVKIEDLVHWESD